MRSIGTVREFGDRVGNQASTATVVPAEAHADVPGGNPPRPVAFGLALYWLSRVFLLATAYGISVSDHLSMSLLLRSWDGKYYIWIAHHGYPATSTNLRAAKPDAFMPIYPLTIRAVHFLTQLSWATSGVLVAVVSGSLLVVAGARVAEEAYGRERAVPAALLLAAFPGSFVAGFTYADSLGLALACVFLLLVQRNRLLLAGCAGMLAAATFSLLVLPLVAVAAWVLIAERRPKAIITGSLVTAVPVSYFLYMWVHTGDAFLWPHVLRVKWASGLGVSFKHGTLWALQADWETGLITSICIVVGVTGLVVLARSSAPRFWVVFSAVVLAISLFDKGTHITARLLYAMVPSILAVGAKVSARWLVPALTIAVLGLCLCLCIFAPENWIFFNP